MERKRVPRVLVATPDLNGHECSAMVFALAFRDAGFEVIYTGGHQTPQQIVSSAIQEDVDMIALSAIASAHTFSFQRMLELLKENDAVDITVICNGNFSLEDIPKLKEMGIELSSLKQNLLNRLISGGMRVNNNWRVEWCRGIAPRRLRKSGHEPLDSSGFDSHSGVRRV